MIRISAADTIDVRFPTSQQLDGSDAMNPDPDYSVAYLTLSTDAGDDLVGAGFVFTIGRGNDLAAAAVQTVADLIVGESVEELLSDLGATYRRFVHDSQLRWLGPEKGVIHMAIGAVVNALWDLKAKRAGLPLWQLVSSMTPAEIVDLVDFRYLSDALTPGEALEILERAEPGRADRTAHLLAHGYPAYTTTPGWLGYSDEKMLRLAREAVADGFTQLKLKVGGNLEDDIRRLALARAELGPSIKIAVDANQRWDVPEAIAWVRELQPYDLAWIEEPTSPDDLVGHATIRKALGSTPVATGEHIANRVMFKQLLQLGAIDVMQIDAARVAGVNENIANLLLAAKFGVRVCPHAGGVGLCEAVQHLSMIDYVAVSGTTENRYLEFVDHLHEHFVDPVRIVDGHYVAPTAPGAGTEMTADSLVHYRHDGRYGHGGD
ncbi:dehydratase [Microlunatus phosphovorus NM-1]|uniref:L-fuconate dehydratase n=1 Tax=Microlunatus phosphovorus (strain ATCC 700054 / DSM 10555 / JCM 9379 / NBRC 101784 / NCIMB 13414 / VKM Ac-1990 / NM-1) TaxID=1032480 RepID=F5XLP1_MICPN|nr:enolase C-terminal domain-like protein [Microlunatus phosphovorus]BAK33770.1 dehydratase [Microlunatus phosphovorus NM-1]